MQDRISTYPGRIRLVPVTGQEHVYDMAWADEPQVEGTGINKANLLPDTVAALSGFSSPDTTVADVLQKSLRWRELTKFETAGVVEWTAPDLYGDGRAYEVGVFLVGAGGNGTIAYVTSYSYVVAGGSSGFSKTVKMMVTPGEIYSGVIGDVGEDTTFDQIVAQPGSNGDTGSTVNSVALWGAQVSYVSTINTTYSPHMDNVGIFVTDATRGQFVCDPAQTVNPFTGEKVLFAGACSYNSSAEVGGYAIAGKNPTTGLGGGNTGINKNGTDATAPGCGGGSARRTSSSVSVVAGKGAPGAIYIYV